MNRRWSLLAGALALSLSAPQAAFATPEQTAAAPAPGPDAAAADALRDLKADADGAVRVRRDTEGDVAFVSSTDGQAMVVSDSSSPRRAAQEQLATYGEAFGIDGTTSKAVVTQTLDSTTGGSVVRADQVVDGVPVFGGQVVMSLDEDQGLVSATSATTDATQVPAPVVGEARARQTALGITAKYHSVGAADLTVTSQGRHLYDPAIVHTDDPMGTRPVWQFEVSNGSDIRETVLIGTGRGEVALHFNDTPGASDPAMNRRVCDNAEAHVISSSSAVPVCNTPARSEGLPAPPLLDDVNAAYANLGATSDTYYDLAGLSLTGTIGATVLGTKTLQSTVRWCFSDQLCPYKNAFWDGTQMVFGTGYAGADDVVGHELTHGYVERTSGLFYLHQSGAINESVADTIGEIVDHRNPATPDSDDEWTIGEDLPGTGSLRSLKDPTLYDGQPDKMSDYAGATYAFDNGDVHANDGIGNKTAYLISQGGTFNGQTITGIDGSDLGLAKTGLLYLDTIPKLTSGADYAQLGNVLVATCQQLAANGTGGFSTSNCSEVAKAVTATELATPPTDPAAAAPKVAVGCPGGAPLTLAKRDDDVAHDFSLTLDSLWQRTPANGAPQNAESGTSSLFGWDPDPDTYGDPSTSSATTGSFTVPTAAGGSYLNFHHAYLFEFDGTRYYDGGEVVVEKLVNGTWTTVTGLPWVNGAPKTRYGTTTKVFGGDSHGYGSSQVNLTSLAGQTVRVRFRVVGDNIGSFYGWWVDDVRLYSCQNQYASVPATTVSAATTSVKVNWTAPTFVGSSPVASYRITRSNGTVNTAPATARTITLTGLVANTNLSVAVAAVTQDGHVGAASSVPIYATTDTLTSVAKIAKNKAFTITAKVVRRGTTTVVAGMPITLQRHVAGKTVWSNVSAATTGANGTRAWSVTQSALTYYRVVTPGVTQYLGSTSAARTVAMS